jgi:acetyl esterase/lipase
MRKVAFFSILFTVSCCSRLDSGQPAQANIQYGQVGESALLLDFYEPIEKKHSTSPWIMWVHGGAWRSGSKSDMPLGKLLESGFAVVSVDYRLSTVAKFPAQVHDINAAIRYVRLNATKFAIDPDKFVIAGSSAGGHLAALVGVSADVPELAGDLNAGPMTNPQAIVSFFGGSNLQSILSQSTPHGLSVRIPALELLLGGQPDQVPELAKLASPVSHVNANDPPLWLFHGDQDPQMPINQSHELDGRYHSLGLRCKLEVIHGGKHGGKEFFTDDRLKKLADELHTVWGK